MWVTAGTHIIYYCTTRVKGNLQTVHGIVHAWKALQYKHRKIIDVKDNSPTYAHFNAFI